MVRREAMALRAFGPETVEMSPAPAGRPCPDALGRYRPLIEDDAPACYVLITLGSGVATDAGRTNAATSRECQERTAPPFRGCQWILLVLRCESRTGRFVGGVRLC